MNEYGNYTVAPLMGLEGLLSMLSDEQQQLASYSSGRSIAARFGFDPEEYGQRFNPVNLNMIREGMNTLPAMQKYLHGQARGEYSQARQGLLHQVGRTGMAGTGSFKNKFNQIGRNFSEQMYQGDKSVQDIIRGYQNQLNSMIGGLYDTSQSLLAGGAEADWGP